MLFPPSWHGEITVTSADGPVPSVDIAVGRLEAALTNGAPNRVARYRVGVAFVANPLDDFWLWNQSVLRLFPSDPLLAFARGYITITDSAQGLHVRYDLAHRAWVFVYAPLTLLVVAARAWSPGPQLRVIGIIALALFTGIYIGCLRRAVRRFRQFLLRAIVGHEPMDPVHSLLP